MRTAKATICGLSHTDHHVCGLEAGEMAREWKRCTQMDVGGTRRIEFVLQCTMSGWNLTSYGRINRERSMCTRGKAATSIGRCIHSRQTEKHDALLQDLRDDITVLVKRILQTSTMKRHRRESMAMCDNFIQSE